MENVGDAGTGLLLTALITIAVVAAVVQVVRIPYTVALVLAGLALTVLPSTPHLSVSPSVILFVFLPVLLFYGASRLNVRELRANLSAIALLAVPGVIATAGLVGLALHGFTGLSWVSALLFGTIVAATDPVAVLAIFGEVGAPRRLATIVTGESLFNDGTALVFFSLMLSFATTQAIEPGMILEHFALAVVGGLALGIVVGIVGTAILRRINDALLETVIMLIMAYGGYFLATTLGASGPLETVAAGIFLGVSGKRAMSATTRVQSSATWEFLDFLANSLLFLLVGLSARPLGASTMTHLGVGLLWPLAVAILAVMLSRLMVVWAVGLLLGLLHHGLPQRWNGILVWAGLRGAVALAAALSLPLAIPDREFLLTLTLGVVLYTLLAQGLTMRPLLRWVGIAQRKAEQDLELAIGRLQVLRVATREVRVLEETSALEPTVAASLVERFAARRADIRAEIAASAVGTEALDRHEERVALRHLLQVQREAAREAAVQGQLSEETLETLLREIDEELAHAEQTLDGDEEA